MPPLPLHPRQPGLAGNAPAGRASGAEAGELIATLRSLGFVVYRKPARRRGNVLTYTNDAGESVRLEQLEVTPPQP